MPEQYAFPRVEPMIDALLAEPAEGDAYPVSGAVAAVVAGLAASLAAAAADRSRDQWEDAAGARAQAQALCRRAMELAQQDATRFATARDALARRGSPDIQASDYELGDAIARAAEPPLALAAGAADTARLAAEIAQHGAGEVSVDAVIAAQLAAAAADAAARLVEVNLVVGGDPDLAVQAREYAAEAARTADTCSGIEL
jgi:formiminotetrahydrofolate cyclodeaminase